MKVRVATQGDRFLGLNHQLARLRADMTTIKRSDGSTLSRAQGGSSTQPASALMAGVGAPGKAGQARNKAGFEGMLRITDEMQLHYQIIGHGPHPLLIPAVRWQLAADEELLRQHTLVFYDLHQRRVLKGLLYPAISPAQELETLCQHLGLAQVALVGWSRFGGMATHYALERAERIARLLLIRPVSEPAEYDLSARDQSKVQRAGRPRREASADRSTLASRDIPLAEAASCQVPTLIIHGDNDPLPISSSQAWAAALPNARLLTMPGAGPSPWNDTPRAFFTAVTQFLEGGWPQGAIAIEAKSA
jgi:pimeloyl-ACP methyl ester carboxylesterase